MLNKLLNIVYKKDEPEIEKRLFCIAVFVAIVVSLFSIIINVSLNLHWVLHFIVGSGSFMLLGIFLLARLGDKYLIWEFIFIALIILSGTWLYNDGPNGSINYLYVLALVVFLSITRRKQHLKVSILVILNLTALYLIKYYYPDLISPYESEKIRESDMLFTFIYTVVFTTLIYRALRLSYEDERNMVQEQKCLLENQHGKILESINYAEGIQKAILQDENSIASYFKSNFIFWKPKDKIGGDFYKVIPHPVHDHIYYVAVADCTGHGVPGALLTMLGMSLLNEILIQDKDIQSKEVLELLRLKVKEALSHNGSSIQSLDGMDMAFCMVNTKTKSIDFAGANRPLYLLRKNELIEYKPDKIPIGAFLEEERPFTGHIINLEDDDVIVLCTDGFADQYGEVEQRKFYITRLKSLLKEISNKPMHEQKDMLVKAFNEWRKNEEQTDDVLVFGFIPI